MTTLAPARPAAPERTERVINSGPRRTLLALLACALGTLPLKSLLSDYVWVVEAWLAMVVVIAPAVILRLRRAPSALDVWPGVVLLVPLLTRLYVPDHAWGGFIPLRQTFGDVGNLLDELHRTTTDEVAPIHSTVAVRFVLCALIGLLAALIDLIAVVGRRGALAGVPLLVVYTVSGAVPRSPVAWFWFSVAAIGYLILLALDASDELREWGRRVSRTGAAWQRQGLAFSAQRIGIIAIIAAVVLPLVVPTHPRNLIADAFHSDNGKGVGGFGATGGGTTIDPFARLKGQLQRDKPIDVMQVHVAEPGVRPFYLRTNVLDKFTGEGWEVSDYGDTEPAAGTGFSTEPATDVDRIQTFEATITITGLGGNAPVFSIPRAIQGLDPATEWSTLDQLLLNATVQRGDRITEVVEQPEPTIQELRSAPAITDINLSRWLELPPLPDYVTKLVHRLTGNLPGLYDRAHAIFDWFAQPKNGFVYSLKTVKGDSGNDLVDFLKNKAGFCQQFAAAMAVMLRAAGVPSRVVLGYEHGAPNSAGNFTVSTFDAHSWVEAYFPTVGWVPFDPTPPAGLSGGRPMDLPWAQHVFLDQGAGAQGPGVSATTTARPAESPSASAAPDARTGGSSGSATHLPLIVTGLVIVALAMLALLPAAARMARRRRRIAAARRGGDPDELWAELSDTALDLGYVWSPARSPRQVSAWLARDAGDTAPALDALAAAVEERRYAPHPHPADTADLARGLLDVSDQLWARRTGRTRLLAVLWPASLGWGRRLRSVRHKLNRRH